MKFARRFVAAAALAVAGVTGLAAPALAWEPTKPIDFIIMAGKGGGADKMARFIQAIVEEERLTSRPLIPENKGGGSGAEALIFLNTARDPDHTIMVTLNSFFTTPLMQPRLGIDAMAFAPIARLAEDTFVLWVHKDEGVASLEDFRAKAAAAGSGWLMAGTGKGAEDEIITDFLNDQFDLTIKYIPYKGGGEVAKDLAGRQVNSTVNNPSEALGFHESGDVIPVVAFTDERIALFPDTPTMKELGIDFSYTMQRSVVGAPGMSPEAQAYYTELFRKVYEHPKWQEYMATQALEGAFIAGDDLAAYWREQIARHDRILRAAGTIRTVN